MWGKPITKWKRQAYAETPTTKPHLSPNQTMEQLSNLWLVTLCHCDIVQWKCLAVVQTTMWYSYKIRHQVAALATELLDPAGLAMPHWPPLDKARKWGSNAQRAPRSTWASDSCSYKQHLSPAAATYNGFQQLLQCSYNICHMIRHMIWLTIVTHSKPWVTQVPNICISGTNDLLLRRKALVLFAWICNQRSTTVNVPCLGLRGLRKPWAELSWTVARPQINDRLFLLMMKMECIDWDYCVVKLWVWAKKCNIDLGGGGFGERAR